MKKTIQTLILVLITAAFANIASADQPESSVEGQDAQIHFTSQQIVDLCANVRADCNKLTKQDLIDLGLLPMIEYAIEQAKEKDRAASKGRKSRLAKLEERVKALENASKPGADENALQEQINALRDELGALANEDGAKTALEALSDELKRIDADHDANELLIVENANQLRKDLDALNDRVRSIQKGIDPIELGVYAGLNAFTSIDPARYTGGVFLLEFTYRVNVDWDIIVDAGLLLSGGEAPLGTYARGAVGRRLDDNFRFDFGGSTSWVGYDSRVEAQALSVLAGPGFRWVADCNFSLMGNIGAGGMFVPSGDTSANFGGLVAGGYVFR